VEAARLSRDVELETARRTVRRRPPNAAVETRPPLLSNSGHRGSALPSIINGEEIFGSTEQSFTGPNRDRGNIFRVSQSVILTEHKMYLAIPTSIPIYFFVYEGEAAQGQFNKIHEVFFASSGTGEGFYSSGKISVPLNAEKFYYIGASWGNAAVVYFRGDEAVPLVTSFGALETGSPSSIVGFPPGETGSNNFGGIPPYFSSVTTTAPLSVNPSAGTVPPGDSAQVWVFANSAGLLSGDYTGAIRITSNDPVTPDTALAVRFSVSSQPVIRVSPDSLVFDTLFIGQSRELTFTVSNIGTAPLAVSGITASDPVFSAAPSEFMILPLTSQTVTATFTPPSAGEFTGYLLIASDDPNTPVDSVFVQGTANEPPVISISPDSFRVTLKAGQTALDTLTIINSGNGTLEFVITLEDASPNKNISMISDEVAKKAPIVAIGNPQPLAKLKNPSRAAQAKILPPDSEHLAFSPPGVAGATKVIDDNSHPMIAGEEIFGSTQSAFGPLGQRGRGNFFSVTKSTRLLEHRLFINPLESTEVWFVVAESETPVGTYTAISAANVTPQGPGQGWYSSGPLNVPLQAGKFYMLFAQWEAPAAYYVETAISPYPIPTSFGELTGGVGWTVASTPQYQTPPALLYNIGPLAFGEPVAYYQTVVTGAGVDWLEVSVNEGMIPPNSSQEVIISYDVSDLVGGDYFADIVVNSNDPLNPEARANVHLTVIGQASISADSVIFANPVFVNDTASANLRIKNSGNGVLNISDIISSNPLFTPPQTPFDVPPFDSLEVPVIFTPLEEGLQTGVLTIFSNDSLNPVIEVGVAATAIPAPAIGVSPDSIAVTVRFGDSLDVPVVISNTGGSDLTWAVVMSNITAGGNSRAGNEHSANAYEKTPTAERECCSDSHLESSPQTEFKFADMQIVEDGSFEAGTPNPFWNEVSSNFGTPLCTLPVCGSGNGTGPHSGDWWCWLGGSSDGEIGSVDQDLIIPLARFAVLKFWLEIPATNTTGFMEVQIDGEVIFRVTEADEETYPVYSEIILDIAAHADGEVHNLKFFSVTDPSPIGATNFFVDDVSIETSGVPFFSIIGENAGTVSPGQTDEFAVRFFGIQNDTTFTAALLINSNDPLRKSLRLPLVLSIADTVVGIGDGETLPKTYAVSPNFPNPFNPATTIFYDIPQASEVTLVVYNILGQKVRTLVNSRKDPGRYSVVWDAANDAGVPAASGIYIYRFQAGDFLQVRKMILLK
jgi:hypothetical protein